MRQKLLNILETYRKADESELRSGLSWYADAHQEAQRIGFVHNLDVRQTAAIIAAVSPGLRWERNIEAAERIVEHKSLKGLGVRWYDGVRKAKRILKGHNPDVALRGNKVRAFASCVLDPRNSLAVCVDGHAYSIWAGRRIALDAIPPLSDRLYVRIASDYCEVAEMLNIRPCQCQAICWLTWRRLHGIVGTNENQESED